MNDSAPNQSRTSEARLSRSAIGRVSGAVSRLFGHGTSIQATGRFLRRQLWAWPIIAAMVFGGAGWWVHHSVENAMRDQRAIDLNAMADASATAIRAWMAEQKVNVQLYADDEQLRPPVVELLALADGTAKAERRLVQAKAQETLRERLKRKLKLSGYIGFLIVSPGGIVLAADQDPPIGKALSGYRKEMFDQGDDGMTLVSRPFRSTLLLLQQLFEFNLLVTL